MKLKEFDYDLPKNLIAQKPMKPRDHSRLLVLDKKSGETEHKYFYNIADYLRKGDVLVLNNSKVFSARLIGKKVNTGGKIEIFLLTLQEKYSSTCCRLRLSVKRQIRGCLFQNSFGFQLFLNCVLD